MNDKPNKLAVVLLSGGLDSATTLAIAKNDGYDVLALSFDYGQRHARELVAARELCNYYEVREHKVINLDLSAIGSSALLGQDSEIPEDRPVDALAEEVPITYVPARNMIMLSCALAWAESMEADAIFIGVNSIDYSGYPDCRPEFLTAFEQAATLGTRTGLMNRPIKLKYPLINMTKSDIVKRGLELGVPFNRTWSCYKGGSRACGRCDSCQLRLKGFQGAGGEDPIEYVAHEDNEDNENNENNEDNESNENSDDL